MRPRKNIVGNIITLVLLSILVGALGGSLVGIATRPKPSIPGAGQTS
jgi:hypothetical protein